MVGHLMGRLSSLIIPESVKEITSLVFEGCTSLKEIVFTNTLKVGRLDLSYTSITSLPDNLKVGGDLYLGHTPIASLPDNLKVGSDLCLGHTPITSLPDNLKVKYSMDLSYTPITSIPNNLKIKNRLNLSHTPTTYKVYLYLDCNTTTTTLIGSTYSGYIQSVAYLDVY